MAKELRELGERFKAAGLKIQGEHLVLHANDWEMLSHIPHSLNPLSIESNQNPRFKFVPFAEQPTCPTREEKLQHPRTHNILFEVDFSGLSLENLEGKSCDICHTPLTRAVQDFIQGWGNIEKLNCVVPNVPQLQCNCRLFTSLENVVAQRLRPVVEIMKLIYRAIEFEKEEDLANLRASLKEEDFSKLMDFILKRQVPEGYISDLRRKAKDTTGHTGQHLIG